MILLPLQTLAKAALTVAVGSFACMDCNPSLWLADVWFHNIRLRGRFRMRCVNNNMNKCWIIGASSGIGQELAYCLAETHDNLELVLSSRSVDRLHAVQQECHLRNPTCTVTCLPMDVTNEQDLTDAVQFIQQKFQTLDTVVLNAGRGHLSPALQTSSDTARKMYESNALWIMTLIPLMFQNNLLKDDSPHLVVTASIASIVPVPLSSTYAAAKCALLGYLRSLQSERPDIRLHTVLPGPVQTDFHPNSSNNKNGAHVSNDMAARNSQRRSPMKLPVRRCARLMHSAMLRNHGSTESWIAAQPLLSALYLHQLLPNFVLSWVYGKMGVKRVKLFAAGLDLYDPASWKKKIG